MRGPLPRRTFLRGSGVAIGLPLLDAMIPARREARAVAAMAPRRFLSYFVPNGIGMAGFTPQRTGTGYDLPIKLEPLARVQGKVSVLSRLDNDPGLAPNQDPHPSSGGAVLTCVRARPSVSEPYNGISVDQVIANAIGKETRFASLQLGAEGGSAIGGCDGYTCDHLRTISWAGPKTPLPKTSNPAVALSRLFANFDPALGAGEQVRRLTLRKSVLDSALGDLSRVLQQVGSADRAKLEEFSGAIRQVETRIDAQRTAVAAGNNASSPTSAACAPMDVPPTNHHPTLVGLMHDVIVLALRCDLTRVITFMWGNAASEVVYFGLPHHKSITHGKFNTVGADLHRVEVSHYAQLLEKMDAISEGGRTLLDSSVVHFTSEFGNGDMHLTKSLPVLLAGSGGGAFRTGQHLLNPAGTPVANMFLAVIRGFQIEAATFGDNGTAPLAGVLS